MESQQRIEQIVVIALLVILAVGCIAVLRPFLSALLWALILSYSSCPLYAWLVRRLGGRRTLAASGHDLARGRNLHPAPYRRWCRPGRQRRGKVGGMVAVLVREGPPGPPAWVAELPIIGTQVTERWLELERLGAGWTAELQPYLDTGLRWLLSLGVRLGEAILQVSLSVLVAFFFFRDGAEGARRLEAAVKRLAGDRAQQLLAVAGRHGAKRGLRCDRHGSRPGHLAGAESLAGRRCPPRSSWASWTSSCPSCPWDRPWSGSRQPSGTIGWGISLIGWGFLVVSSVDNVLRPYLISRGSRLPLILMFFGVLGGLLAFGFLGVFLDPTLLAIGYVLFQEWSSAPRSATNEVAAEVAPGPLVQPRAAEGSSASGDMSRNGAGLTDQRSTAVYGNGRLEPAGTAPPRTYIVAFAVRAVSHDFPAAVSH